MTADSERGGESGASTTHATTATCRFRVGRGLALVCDPTYLLVDPANGLFAERLWQLIVHGASVDDVLEELSAVGLRSLGNFAMAHREATGLRVVVRGAGTATVVQPTGEQVVRGDQAKTWVEEVFEGARGFSLRLPGVAEPSEDLPFRIASGIVPADVVAWSVALGDPTPRLEAIDFDWVDSFTPAALSGHEEAPSVKGDTHPAHTGADSSGDDGSNAGPSPDEGYDYLYGHTVAKSVQEAAVGADEDGTDEVPDSDEAVEESQAEDLPAGPPVASPPLLIDEVPSEVSGVDSTPPPQPRSGGRPSDLGDHDGNTISLSQLRQLRAPTDAQTREAPRPGAPTVRALLCAAGHANPPHIAECRSCSNPLSGNPVVVERPRLGRLTLSTGQVVELDRPAIIGRNPKLEGSMPSEVPQLIRVDVGKALSRSHALVRLDGWQVLLEDLGSANGTTVTLPGREAQLLYPREPVILESGAQVDFGGELGAVFEAVTE